MIQKFNLFPLQRRRKRYRMIYIRKILENMVPNIGNPGIRDQMSLQNGCTVSIRTVNRNATTRIQKMRKSSLDVHGSPLFDCLPRSIQNLSGCGIEKFKSNLDRFLKLVLDEPLIPGYTMMRRVDSNSLLDLQVIIIIIILF